MKILFTVTVFFPQIGGSSRIYYELCNRLPVDEVCVLTQRRLSSESNEIEGWREFDKRQKFKIYRVNRLRPKTIKIKKKPNLFISLYRFIFTDLPLMLHVTMVFSYILFKEKVDIVCFDEHDYLGWLAIINKYIFRRKVIFYQHGDELLAYSGSRVFEKLRFFCLSKSDRIIANSKFTKSILSEHNLGSKTLIINPGIDILKFMYDKPKISLSPEYSLGNKKVLLTITRLDKQKGIDNVIKAIPLVLKKIPNLIYLIGGCGSQEEFLMDLVDKLNLKDIIKFLGFISEEELPGYYDLCDVFVLANRPIGKGILEGFGMVFIEAGSRGKPVIGGGIGGVPEAIIDGETGILVDGTNVNEIANSIIKLMENPELASRLGNNGRERAKQFGWEKVVQEFRKVCLELNKEN